MSSLKHIERIKLEKFLNMGSGYVSDFSDRTFRDFVMESVEVDIYSDGYDAGGTSKANRLRNFWKTENNYLTAELLKALLEYQKIQLENSPVFNLDPQEYEECISIVEKLEQEIPIEDIEAFTPNSSDKHFASLSASIKASIKKGQPEQALDRLHTFVGKYIRTLCEKHGIQYDKEIALHSLFGSYVKFLEKRNRIESEMSQRILKSSISVLEAFNNVRNNQSFAHDNIILNGAESILIFNNISNILRFIEHIENKIDEAKALNHSDNVDWDDLTFQEYLNTGVTYEEAIDLGII